MTKKTNELIITSYVVAAFFLFLTLSFYLAELFDKVTGSKRFLIFYRDSNLAFYGFWAVLLIPMSFYFNRNRPREHSSAPLLTLVVLVLWTVPNFIFPGTNGAFPSNEVLYMNILPAVLEELLFRGFLLLVFVQLFQKYKRGQVYALVLASILFGLWHFSPIDFQMNFSKLAIHCLGGLTLGFLFLRTRSLLPCMLIHYLGNVSHFYFPYFRSLI